MTKNVYDGFDRQTHLFFPDATPANDNDNPNEQYAYDPGGRRTSMVNRANQTLTYQYNDLDQLISRTGPSLPTREQHIQGGEISAFFRGQSILAGDDFMVRVVP